MIRRSVFLILVSVVFSTVGFSQQRPKKEASEPHLSRVLQNTVEEFFHGKEPHSIIVFIKDGKISESIPNPEDLKKSYDGCKFMFYKAYFSPDMNTAVMTLETEGKGAKMWHTFVMMTGIEGKWEIRSWHSSRAS